MSNSNNDNQLKALASVKTLISAGIPGQRATPSIPSFDDLADNAFIREAQLVQSPKRPDRPAPLPFSAPTLWRKVKNLTFPKPVRLSERITAWRVGDVRDWIAAQTKS